MRRGRERVRFIVTQEHIDRGVKSEPESCPVALAIGGGASVFDATTFDNGGMWWNSRRTQRFIRAFDKGKPVKPFTGEVYR